MEDRGTKGEQLRVSQKCFMIWTEWRYGQHGEIDQNTGQHFPKATLVLVVQSPKSILFLSEVALIQKRGRNQSALFSGG